MTLQTIAKCVKINKKSTSPAFKNMEVGDIILFSCDMEYECSMKQINCHNQRTGEHSYLTFKQIHWVLKNFEFEELLRL